MATIDAYMTARKTYQNMIHQSSCFESGRRNNDAVNWCIVCYVLGKDPVEELKNALNSGALWGDIGAGDATTLADFEERAEVINAYIESDWAGTGISPQLDTQVLSYAFDSMDEFEWVHEV